MKLDTIRGWGIIWCDLILLLKTLFFSVFNAQGFVLHFSSSKGGAYFTPGELSSGHAPCKQTNPHLDKMPGGAMASLSSL